MSIDFGDLRRTTPISRHFGYDRGTPVDRYYIERFLALYAGDIQGRTLEIGDDGYCRRFGGNRTTRRDVLHVHSGNTQATFIGDLTNADHIPGNIFDCCVITQTLHLIFDVSSALRTIHRILKPGGVLLATFPGVSQVSVDEWCKTWSWGFERRWAERAFQEVFGQGVTVATYGNLLSATCFLHGIAVEEVEASGLDEPNAAIDMLIGVRTVKSKDPRR